MWLTPFPSKIYLMGTAVDMRKSIDGLCIWFLNFVRKSNQPNPLSFCNRQKDKIKLLYWDGNGFCLFYKRLEKGKFQAVFEKDHVSLTPSELHFLWQGFNFKNHPKKKEFFFKNYS